MSITTVEPTTPGSIGKRVKLDAAEAPATAATDTAEEPKDGEDADGKKQRKKKPPKPDTEELYVSSKHIGVIMKKALPADVTVEDNVKGIYRAHHRL